MRRATISLDVAAAAVLALALAGVASAAPTVQFKAKAVPIPGFPHTGNIFGAGAAFESEFQISGTEYGGFPPPLEHVNVYLPAGVKLHTTGFPTCAPSVLEPSGKGPKACAKAKAGPTGSVQGFVAFGKEVVPETATIESFYAPGGGLEFFTFGHEPVLLEILSKGHFVNSSGLYSKKFEADVPLVETVPGAQRRVGQVHQGQDRLGDQEERQSDLLRHDADEVPEEIPAGEGRTHVRRTRRPDQNHGHGRIQGSLPAQEVAAG